MERWGQLRMSAVDHGPARRVDRVFCNGVMTFVAAFGVRALPALAKALAEVSPGQHLPACLQPCCHSCRLVPASLVNEIEHIVRAAAKTTSEGSQA